MFDFLSGRNVVLLANFDDIANPILGIEINNSWIIILSCQ